MGTNYDFIDKLKIDDNLQIYVTETEGGKSSSIKINHVKQYLKDTFKGIEENYYSNPMLSLYCCRKLLEASLHIFAKMKGISTLKQEDENENRSLSELLNSRTDAGQKIHDELKDCFKTYSEKNNHFRQKTDKASGQKIKIYYEEEFINNCYFGFRKDDGEQTTENYIWRLKTIGLFDKIRELGNNDAHILSGNMIQKHVAVEFLNDIYPKLYVFFTTMCIILEMINKDQIENFNPISIIDNFYKLPGSISDIGAFRGKTLKIDKWESKEYTLIADFSPKYSGTNHYDLKYKWFVKKKNEKAHAVVATTSDNRLELCGDEYADADVYCYVQLENNVNNVNDPGIKSNNYTIDKKFINGLLENHCKIIFKKSGSVLTAAVIKNITDDELHDCHFKWFNEGNDEISCNNSVNIDNNHTIICQVTHPDYNGYLNEKYVISSESPDYSADNNQDLPDRNENELIIKQEENSDGEVYLKAGCSGAVKFSWTDNDNIDCPSFGETIPIDTDDIGKTYYCDAQDNGGRIIGHGEYIVLPFEAADDGYNDNTDDYLPEDFQKSSNPDWLLYIFDRDNKCLNDYYSDGSTYMPVIIDNDKELVVGREHFLRLDSLICERISRETAKIKDGYFTVCGRNEFSYKHKVKKLEIKKPDIIKIEDKMKLALKVGTDTVAYLYFWKTDKNVSLPTVKDLKKNTKG